MIDTKSQAPLRQNSPNHHQIPQPQQGHFNPPHTKFKKKPTWSFTPLIESQAKLFEKLNVAGIIHAVGPKPIYTSSQLYRANRKCAYHSNSVGHDTEDCINLEHKIQGMIDRNVVMIVVPNVKSNLLLN